MGMAEDAAPGTLGTASTGGAVPLIAHLLEFVGPQFGRHPALRKVYGTTMGMSCNGVYFICNG
jgi:hypothetical protein